MTFPEGTPPPLDPARQRELEQFLASMDEGLTEEERLHGHRLPFHGDGRRLFFGIVPVFLVDDVVATCEYYQGVLGFEVNFTYGEPASFACVSRGQAMINLNLADPAGARNHARAAGSAKGSDAYVLVTHLDEVLEELRQRGATLLGMPEQREYGMREFRIEDCNGYRLTLAEGIIGG